MQKSVRFAGIGAALLVVSALAACQPGTYASADSQRAVIGAVGGAVTAKAFDRDPVTGAVAGAAAGALCDDAGICRPAY